MRLHEFRTNTEQPANPRLISIRTVCHLTSLSRATIYRLVDDAKFPKALKITPNRIAWREQAVLDWLATLG